ncbi:hypothetical protein G3T14_09800 [Methylobacterium sp. BTF04]|uniref:hypothetical protein n=1 Tax=Methylobacterium sp. BTF04 TaxID=2708300 RepID=UPI0013D6924F|nr:hypothetical protein [Methylobacterium sp. BTF04]NEU12427.1 hypothetical protein [Methylobacterium sp. BTF04]
MSEPDRRSVAATAHDIAAMRHLLALLSAETKLVRVRHLLRKYSPDQLRVPAGQSDGGQWVSPGGGSDGGSLARIAGGRGQWASLVDGDSAVQRTLLAGGGEVLSIRVRSGPGEWDEHHRVTTPDGEIRVFENSGPLQTIRDGQTGEVLSRSTFRPSGIEADATVQPAFLPGTVVVPPVIKATIEAALLLFTVLAGKGPKFGEDPGTEALRFDFDPAEKMEFPTVWVGRVDNATLDQVCPHHQEVQAVTDEATKRLTALNPNLNKRALGSVIHFDIAETFRKRNYPEIKVEFSLDKTTGKIADYGNPNSARLDIYELGPDQMVCVYDPKTSLAGLYWERALVLARAAKRHFPTSRGIIMIQVRPRP